MKIEKNTESITTGKRYFLELVSVDGGNTFSTSPTGRLKLTSAHLTELYSPISTHPAFARCKDCTLAVPDGPRNVSCQYNPSISWSKMSKACHHFTSSQT